MRKDNRTSHDHPFPIEILLDDDGTPPHGPDCQVCGLFPLPGESREASIRRLAALYKAAPPVYQKKAPPPPERPCVVCETPHTINGLYCSKACRQLAYRERRRAS